MGETFNYIEIITIAVFAIFTIKKIITFILKGTIGIVSLVAIPSILFLLFEIPFLTSVSLVFIAKESLKDLVAIFWDIFNSIFSVRISRFALLKKSVLALFNTNALLFSLMAYLYILSIASSLRSPGDLMKIVAITYIAIFIWSKLRYSFHKLIKNSI